MDKGKTSSELHMKYEELKAAYIAMQKDFSDEYDLIDAWDVTLNDGLNGFSF